MHCCTLPPCMSRGTSARRSHQRSAVLVRRRTFGRFFRSVKAPREAYAPDHGRAALGVHREVLPGDDASAPGLAKRLHLHSLQLVLLLHVLQHRELARVAPKHQVVLQVHPRHNPRILRCIHTMRTTRCSALEYSAAGGFLRMQQSLEGSMHQQSRPWCAHHSSTARVRNRCGLESSACEHCGSRPFSKSSMSHQARGARSAVLTFNAPVSRKEDSTRICPNSSVLHPHPGHATESMAALLKN